MSFSFKKVISQEDMSPHPNQRGLKTVDKAETVEENKDDQTKPDDVVTCFNTTYKLQNAKKESLD